jgi:hypothetical protein
MLINPATRDYLPHLLLETKKYRLKDWLKSMAANIQWLKKG